ncbi:FxsA family protein [Agarivorans sp. MS3-6]|uniref:FxsA family protein n=1 Tax=Agarivorans sp. TSD2052 TaxID=2937286 RepID=UPI00200DFDB2|nr:FxsA family protein [Agarivorans sp. TSD2052]UPW18093.1 FxsA family protein [Agarivorans sp. TSD2052]
MFLYVFLLFAGLSYAEIYVLIQVGSQMGALSAIALTILTALVGASLVRSQGLQTAFQARTAMERGETPAQQMIEGLMLIVAGAMLVMPGFITDFFGLMILLPPLRALLASRVLKSQMLKMQSVKFQTPPGAGADVKDANPLKGGNVEDKPGNTIEGEFERKDD